MANKMSERVKFMFLLVLFKKIRANQLTKQAIDKTRKIWNNYIMTLVSSSNQGGFTITAALMSVAIVGVGMSAMISMLSFQHRELQSIKEQLISSNIKQFILQTMKDLRKCDCHFNSSLNSGPFNGEAVGPFTIDMTTPPIGDINLGSLRTGCDFTGTNNIIVAAGATIKNMGRLKTKSVRAKKIQPTTTLGEYQAELTVDFETPNRPLRPVVVDILLSVDTTVAGAQSP